MARRVGWWLSSGGSGAASPSVPIAPPAAPQRSVSERPPTIPGVRERLRPILQNLATFVAPGLVLLLLAIQVAFGLRGFDRPDESLLQVLQVPGVLLGWGGVALLLPLLVWMVLDWWGYDLGGFALKGLGSAVLGIATGALCGLAGDVAAGGIVGGGLADVLRQTVGPHIAFGVLGLMAIPAAVLAFSLQKRAERPARDAAPRRNEERPSYGLWAHVRGLFGRRSSRDPAADTWYPERRFDEAGNELPMDFGRQRDVGGIRYVEPETEDEEPDHEQPADDAESTEPPAAPRDETPPLIADLLEDEERLPTIPELLAGNYAGGDAAFTDDPSGGPRETDAAIPDDGPIHVDSEGKPHPVAPAASVRSQTPTAAAEEPEVAEEGRRHVADDAGQQRLAFVATREPESVADPALPPGVRWADEPAPPEPETDPEELAPEEEPADLPALSAALEHAVRGPEADPQDAAHTARSIRETLQQKVEAIRADGASSRYMAKLEAIGLFDPAEPEAVEQPKPAKRKKGPKKAAKKKVARKKTAKKKKSASKTGGRRTSPAVRSRPKKKAAAKRKPRTQSPRRPDPVAAGRKRREALLEGLRIERLDPLFARAVEAALDRGAASPVLLTRRLGLPFARAKEIVDRMIAAGVLEEASPSGSHAVSITKAEWAQTGA